MKKIVAVALVFIVLLSGCIWQGEKRETSTNLNSTNQTGNVIKQTINTTTAQKNTTSLQANNTKSFIYLFYSPLCPHCEHLIEYLKNFENEKNIAIVKTTKVSKYLGVLKRFNFSWDGGVPLLFAIVENKTLVAIEGYPSKDQEVSGYFLGKEKEQEFCKKLNGREVFENKEYKFCKLTNNVIFGNKYAVDYLINICKAERCYAVD